MAKTIIPLNPLQQKKGKLNCTRVFLLRNQEEVIICENINILIYRQNSPKSLEKLKHKIVNLTIW